MENKSRSRNNRFFSCSYVERKVPDAKGPCLVMKLPSVLEFSLKSKKFHQNLKINPKKTNSDMDIQNSDREKSAETESKESGIHTQVSKNSDQLVTTCPSPSSDALNSELQNKIDRICSIDYEDNIKTYLEILDIIFDPVSSYGTLLKKLKNGLQNNINNLISEKLENKKEAQRSKETIIQLKKNKESLIAKLNNLSSINIDLMRKYDESIANIKVLNSHLERFSEDDETKLSLIKDLYKKNEIIAEMNTKIKSMANQQAKLIKICETLNIKNPFLEEILQKIMPLHRTPVTKHKKVPLLVF